MLSVSPIQRRSFMSIYIYVPQTNVLAFSPKFDPDFQNPDHMAQKVLPALFDQAYSINLNGRHGAVTAIGQIVHALSVVAEKKELKIGEFLNDDIVGKLRGLVGIFRTKLYFKGMGGELMKQACCSFIEKCSQASLPFHGEPVLGECRFFMDLSQI